MDLETPDKGIQRDHRKQSVEATAEEVGRGDVGYGNLEVQAIFHFGVKTDEVAIRRKGQVDLEEAGPASEAPLERFCRIGVCVALDVPKGISDEGGLGEPEIVRPE